MQRFQRQNHASSSVLGPSSGTSSPSSISTPSPARVTLPSDLSRSLKYLDDDQLNRLLEAVTVEINRRNQGGPKSKTAAAAPTRAPSPGQSASTRKDKIGGIDQIPEGTANLIGGAFRAGVKTAETTG